jgi:hypothetical protein
MSHTLLRILSTELGTASFRLVLTHRGSAPLRTLLPRR